MSSPVRISEQAGEDNSGHKPATSPPNRTAASDTGGGLSQMPPREIVVKARAPAPAGDPLQAVNARSYAVAQKVDDAVVGPIAHGYEHAVPKPVRSGIRNFLNNTREPVVFLSFLLELKPGKAGETAGRFAINSTVGIGGVFDIAKRKPFHLPRRPNGLADALGYYGVRPGPFLFLPLIGPTTVRDALGGFADRLVLPMAIGTPFNQFAYAAGTGSLSALDRRIEFDGQLQEMRDQDNPYATRRALYLKQRQVEIQGLHNRVRPIITDYNIWSPGRHSDKTQNVGPSSEIRDFARSDPDLLSIADSQRWPDADTLHTFNIGD